MLSLSISRKDAINFKAHFRTEYPNATNMVTKKGRGHRVYVCLHCPDRWESSYTSNALNHARNRHQQEINTDRDPLTGNYLGIPNTQNSMSLYVTSIASSSSLRNVFNTQQYNEAIVGLLTRRRIPFSAVEWDEIKNLALACNPVIEDCLITNRRGAMRIIDANYELYTGQLKEQLQESQSIIHLSTDLWISPYYHGILAVYT